ncbi:MAG: ATP-binding protein [Candidatus Bathyarchaeia archaeon]
MMIRCELFDTRPKRERSLLYGREDDLKEIEQIIDSGFWAVLIGPKRIGKTSLATVLTKSRGGIYIDVSSVLTVKELGLRLIDEVAGGRLKTEGEIDLKVFRLTMRREPIQTFEKVIRKLGNRLIALDEVQRLNDRMLPRILSTLYNETKIKLLFTGSATGLIKTIAESAEIQGKPIEEKEINPFSRDISIAFLETGFQRGKINYEPRELEEAVDRFGGIPGWLTYYGAKRCSGKSHPEAMEEVTRLAKKTAIKESKDFGSLQRAIVLSLARFSGGATWNEIKVLAASKYKQISKSSTFTESLKSLQNLRIIEKKAEKYYLVDPAYKLLER